MSVTYPASRDLTRDESPSVYRRWFTSWSEPALTYCGFLSLTLLLQFLSGTYTSEFAGYADEPSHYVTGLMVRDYFVSGFHTPPLEYATGYYFHYPKVAIGHWPPLFYLIEALWMLAFSYSRVSILVLMAVITTLLATVLASNVRSLFGRWAGLLIGCAFVALPDVQSQTAQVMPEILLALFGFAAAIHFGRYLDTGELRDSLWFAVYATLCILTKGNGWAIVLMPPLAILLTRKFRLILSSSFWAGALLIASICLPWHAFTVKFVKHVWIAKPGSVAYIGPNFIDVLRLCAELPGLLLFLMAIVGMTVTCLLPALRGRVPGGQWAAMTSLLLAVCVLNIIVPLTAEKRKLLMAVPPMLLLIAAGFRVLLDRVGPFGRSVQRLCVGAAIFFFLIQTFTIPKKLPLGFIDAAGLALATQSAQPPIYLVSGTATGEGAFIAEVAMHDRTRRARVVRATKGLAHSEWDGSNYRPLFKTTDEIRRYLNDLSASVIVVEDVSLPHEFPHHILLTRVLNEDRSQWISVPVSNGAFPARVKVFRRASGGDRAGRRSLSRVSSQYDRAYAPPCFPAPRAYAAPPRRRLSLWSRLHAANRSPYRQAHQTFMDHQRRLSRYDA
jgi:uncharacterized membrane protein